MFNQCLRCHCYNAFQNKYQINMVAIHSEVHNVQFFFQKIAFLRQFMRICFRECLQTKIWLQRDSEKKESWTVFQL